ncbi:hypothetical protein CORC01_05822 [Colletotrichum orchidophilum]|uniref:RED-like N-terminal domain-containing protein n=1 Tax=Colletotrichum orchidophilum TaxID=1209926 RepID=A0A1G4BC46_9PEZI|nr:uncharacterized protein CORC01_05822 [Colletotrichum orchidophilum]OHE98926.1 hypothetical protein CORC01_05822 [Colletotrichum orchidophilum]
MNNEQFRKLLGADSGKAASPGNGPAKGSATPGGGALGSRQRSSIPMTPYVALPTLFMDYRLTFYTRRSVGVGNSRNEFARQLAERNQAGQPQKKFRTSAPKGSRLAEGYVDRARDRTDNEDDDRAKRIKALEEALKNEEIDQATFEKLSSEIAGGDLSSTHLIKGLDFKLLERVRKGEDVFGDEKDDEKEDGAPPEEEVDNAFDELEGTEVQAVEKERAKKKGQLAPVALAPGKKRTRDQILAEMKAAREAAKAQQEAALNSKFKKIGVKQQPGSRIERDSKGREVLIIVDEDGHEKRKVRKLQPGVEEELRKEFIPDKDAKPLGMEVPEFYQKQQQEVEEDDNDDIFADAGDDYDPLAGMDDSSDEESEGDVKDAKDAKDERSPDTIAMPPPLRPTQARNYFKDSKTDLISSQTLQGPSMSDPAIQAAFKRAAQLKAANKDQEEEAEDGDEEAKARRERHKRMLQSVDRDAEDMDMGFGTSRFEDEADFDDAPVKLSEWGNEGDDDDGQGGKSKRKRGPKKRKGDVNNAADVLRVMEQRKAAGK